MFRKTVLMLFLAAALIPSLASAQRASHPDNSADALEEAILDGRVRPFLELSYGMATPQFKGLDTDFKGLGMMELKIGYSALDSLQPGIVSLMDGYLFASWFNDGLGSSGDDTDAGSKLNRFGGGNRFGYGYQGTSMALDLYSQDSFNWTQIEPVDYDGMPADAQAVFDRYGTSYRFGQILESGMKFRVSPAMSLNAGLEGAIIYPRYVFWPWLGSVALYSGVQGAVEYFSEEIVQVSPVAGPALYFLLKTGVSLGYYLASRDGMNWPFDSETPLTVETFKVSASFKF